jgi:succinyl-diaminopimelate desuccinylase
MMMNCEERSNKLIQFVRDLIQIPSVNGIHGETAVSQRIVQEANALGVDAKLVGIDDNRMNVVATVHVGNDINCNDNLFLFIGHVDTVSLGSLSEWKYPPLDATIDGNNIVGRGACDNKAGIACSLYTMAKLKENWKHPTISGNIVLAGVVDEESGANSDIGCRYLLKNNIISGCKGAIYNEPNRNITLGHRGLIRIEINVKGMSWHSGSSQWCSGRKGANAVMALVEVLYKIENYEWPLHLHESFPNLRLTITPGTVFNGGTFESSVPDTARAMIDIRTMPDTDPDFVINTITSIAEQVISDRNKKHYLGDPTRSSQEEHEYPSRLSFSMTVKNKLPASVIPGGVNHPLPQACIAAVKSIVNEDNCHVGACGPANEGYMLMNEGIPTICGFGPIGGNAHAVNEWIDIDSLDTTVDIYSYIVQDYLERLNHSI